MLAMLRRCPTKLAASWSTSIDHTCFTSIGDRFDIINIIDIIDTISFDILLTSTFPTPPKEMPFLGIVFAPFSRQPLTHLTAHPLNTDPLHTHSLKCISALVFLDSLKHWVTGQQPQQDTPCMPRALGRRPFHKGSETLFCVNVNGKLTWQPRQRHISFVRT